MRINTGDVRDTSGLASSFLFPLHCPLVVLFRCFVSLNSLFSFESLSSSSFMQSGGFSPSSKVSKIASPSLVLWGRQDGILDGTEFANKVSQIAFMSSAEVSLSGSFFT